jgi:hypothetical protein
MIAKRLILAVGIVTTLAAWGCSGAGQIGAPTRTGPIISIAPIESVKPGEDFVASIRISNVLHLGGFQFTLDYGASRVAVTSEDVGDFLASTGRVPSCLSRTPPNALTFACATTEPPTAPGSPTQTALTAGPSGDGELARVHLRVAADASGTVEFQLASVLIVDPQGEAIESSSSGTSIKIQSQTPRRPETRRAFARAQDQRPKLGILRRGAPARSRRRAAIRTWRRRTCTRT